MLVSNFAFTDASTDICQTTQHQIIAKQLTYHNEEKMSILYFFFNIN